ncbi:MAG: asparaginase [Pseudohongiellaceae bacterium]
MAGRLLILYTGGTIGMKQTDRGLAPASDLTTDILQMPELGPAFHGDPPVIETLSYDPLLDSSDMTPGHWCRMADDIARHYDDHDGFVVLHGTDTLAYTSSALGFFLHRSGKPVVVTGAQLPFGSPRSDARNNLISSLQVAASLPGSMAQVCVVFGSRILQGNRSTKVSAQAYDAFDSPRFPHIGSIGIDIEYNSSPAFESVRPAPAREGLREDLGKSILENNAPPPDDAVALVRLFPGFSAATLRAICSGENLRGIVLEAYGAGNGPSRDRSFLDAVRSAVDQGIVVVVVSQPLDGVVRMSSYAAGNALADAGAISGRDLTTEAALTKLYYLIAQGCDAREIRERMVVALAGEIG